VPNWCDNRATITGPEPVISEIKEILNTQDPALLAWMVKEPKYAGDQDWYGWRVENWGSKWDISSVYVDDVEDDTVSFSFSSAWSPPIEAFKTWAERDGRVTFHLEFWESGVAFAGEAGFDGDCFYDTIIDCNDSSYKDWIKERWDYEEEEEPEPLTEWYTQGVEDKGLDK
jgi:succinate dehydrogenase flavin-adding protein (antitoxin of CptAB toxin-antitoxin module)